MKTFLKYLSVVFVILMMLPSCKSTSKFQDVQNMGVTEFYENFWWHKYDTVWMTKTLEFEFNNDAKRFMQRPMKLEVVTRDDESTKLGHLDGILVKIIKGNDTIACPKHVFEVTKDDQDVELLIAFTHIVPEGEYDIHLQVIDDAGLDMVESQMPVGGLIITKEDVSNPLAKGALFTLISVFCLLVLWILIVHTIINPSTYFTKAYFDYNGAGADRPIRMEFAYKLVCTSSFKKTSWLKKVFWGDVKYEVNDFWTTDFVLANGARRRKIYVRGDYSVNLDEIYKGDEFVVTNAEGKTVKIQL